MMIVFRLSRVKRIPEIHKQAVRAGLDTMTEQKINNEIKAARQTRHT
jgi:hypothetical protein